MSSLGNLNECLMDGDSEAVGRARRLRRKALTLALAVEAVLIAAMLLWPLITPGVLPRQYVFTPAPPYHGGGAAHVERGHQADRPATGRHPQTFVPIVQPPMIPPHVQESAGADEPNIEAGYPGGGNDIPGATGDGSRIPGGSDEGPAAVLPPPPPRPSAPVRRSEGVMEASLIRRIQPVYPIVAKTAHISGTVELRAIIATDGSVRQLQVLSGNPILAQAAVTAVREWRYSPTRLNGLDVEVDTLITVHFVLEQ
jgi:periplasmic protein TonB